VIAGKKWKVKTTDKNGGGWFDAAKATISISKKYPQDIGDIFIHEVLESIIVERNCRYKLSRTPQENGDLMFIMNHREFEVICSDLAYALFHKDNPILRKRKRQ
jgi:hypothetical protein